MAEEGSPHPFTFVDIYYFLVALIMIWVAGKFFSRFGLPSLCGEIVIGVVIGPHMLDLAPKRDALMMFGEIGLMFLFLEAGLDIDVEMVRLVGKRGVALSLIASFISLLFGTLLSKYILKLGTLESWSVGIALAPTSMGIGLNVLRSCKVLNTPSGQLIIASAMLQDVIGILMLGELEATKDPSFTAFMIPVVSSLCFLIIMGYLAVNTIPKHFNKFLHQFHHHHDRESLVMGCILFLAVALIPATHYTKSSYLLGCFLAGLCFCTDHHSASIWQSQVKRILQWLMRLFFACTIGFEVPIKNLSSAKVWTTSLVFLLIILLKMGAGFLANPLTVTEVLKLGLSVISSCELCFIIAVMAFHNGIMSADTFDGIILSSLISTFLAPFFLRKLLESEKKSKQEEIARARAETMMIDELGEYTDDDDGPRRGEEEELVNGQDEEKGLRSRTTSAGSITSRGSHASSEKDRPRGHQSKLKRHLYLLLQTKCRGQWGHQDRLLKALFELNMSIIDFRSFHPHGTFAVDVVSEIYIKDNTEPFSGKIEDVEKRMKQLQESAKRACGTESAEIKISQWLPGATPSNEKSYGGVDGSNGKGNRRKALAHDEIMNQLEQIAYVHAEREFKKRHRHHTSIAASMAAHTHPLELVRQEKHHELDGFVHTDAHDAFDPDEIEGEIFDSESDTDSDDSDVYGSSRNSPSCSRATTPRPSLEKEDFMAWKAGMEHDERQSTQQGLVIELQKVKKAGSKSGETDDHIAEGIVDKFLAESNEARL